MNDMKGIYTKKIAAALSLVSVLGMMSTGAVYADDFDDVCSRIDSSDLPSITTAKGSLKDITKVRNNAAIIELAKSSGLTEAEVTKLLVASMLPYYSTTGKEIEATKDRETIKDILGEDTDTDSWYSLFLDAREDPYTKSIANGNQLRRWALGSASGAGDVRLTPVFDAMDELLVKAMEIRLSDSAYKDINAKLEAFNWTPKMIVDACREVSNEVEVSYDAEYALIKAAARYGTKLFIDSSEVKLTNSGMDLSDTSNIYTVSPDAVGDSIETYITVLGIRKATNLVGYYSSDESVVQITPDESNNSLMLNIKGAGTADVIYKRDPSGANDVSSNKDWLVKFRVVVGDKIADAEKPGWDTTGKLTWNAVSNAKRYKVTLYKDGVEFKTYETTETSYDFSKIAVETGSYTATVQAFGATDAEYGNVSPMSDPYTVKAEIEKVKKPLWDVATEKKLVKWEKVDKATGYIVRIYKDGKAEAVKEYNVADVNECDVTADVKDFGTYYATVQAAAGELKGIESDRTSAYVVAATVALKGNVKLQGAMVGGVQRTRDNNSKITVTVKSGYYVLASTVTDSNGDYTFSELPSAESYTIYFERDSYLKKKITVKKSGNSLVAEDAVMFYGDLNNDGFINIADITRLIPVINKDNQKYDIDDDGLVTVTEFGSVCRNAGKYFED